MEPTTEVVQVAPLIQPTIEWIVGLAAILGAWAIKWIAHYARQFRVEDRTHGLLKEAQLTAWLQESLADGIEYGRELMHKHGQDVREVRVRNALLANAANYVIRYAPKTLSDLGLNRAHVLQMLAAKLPTPDQPPPDPMPVPAAAALPPDPLAFEPPVIPPRPAGGA